MTEADAQPETTVERRARVPLWLRIVKWLALALIGLVLLVALVALGLDTSPGRRFIADRLAGYTTESGLSIRVGRIDGSVYGEMILSDVRVSDPKGVFLTSPRLDVDWRPFAFLNNHVDVRSLTANRVSLLRRPALKPGDNPNAPLLPDLDIDIGKLAIDRLVIAKPVTGAVHVVKIASAVHIANRTAQLSADAAALVGPGIAGGDTLHLRLDGAPDKNRLDFNLKLDAPAAGLVAGLAGIHAPLMITAGGNGDWHSWRGRAVSRIGGDTLADLMLTARDGRFTVRGTTHPALYFRPAAKKGQVIAPQQLGPLDRLTAPALQVAIDATLDQRKADTRVQLTSSALSLSGSGILDLGQSQFGNARVDVRLLTPGAIAPNLKGRDVAGTLILNGPFATPTVQYALRAAAISFGDTTVEQVSAQGLARVESRRILIPVQAKALRVSGISAAGGLLDNVSINGNVAISGSTILADNLRIRSNRINGTAIVVANLATGKYTGALKGQVNNYRIDSIGILNLKTDAHLVTAKGGGFGIAGHVVARTQQIFNSGARSFLGGNAVMAADVGYDPKGVVTFTNVRMSAPQFRILHGSGRYDLKGGLQVAADAYSTSYGPLSARVSGSISSPVVLLRAARPGLGVGLADVVAEVRGRNGAYAITAKGGSNYGPFTADVLATPGKELTIAVHNATFAGINLHGDLRQTVAGPFAGRLQFAGSGVTGAALLAAQGDVQRADIAAHAYAAKIPGPVDFTIGRAIVNGVVVLYPQAPQVTADVQVADLRYGKMVLSAARAKVDYQNGSGTAQAVATGSSGVPFHLALNAKLSPHLWLAALQGQASGINFKTATPARIETDNGYRLLPTRIDFDQGSARIAGTYGDGLSLQMVLDKLNLAVANALVPDLGIDGNATGQLNFAQHGDAVPQIDAHLSITNFSRSDVAAVSEPVDIETIAKLSGDGGNLRALIKRGPTTVGRIVADLRPIPGGSEGWVSRLMGAPLSGGIRYNGPSAVLFSFAALPRQQLTGPIAVAADFSGRLGEPQLNGLIRADNLTYENNNFGTRLTNISVAGRFTADRLEISKLQAKAGDGTVLAQGSVGLSADGGFPIQLSATLNNAQLAKGDALGATATGTLQITNDPKNGALVKGDLTIPQLRYAIVRQGQAEVPVLTGVRRKGEAAPTPAQVNANAGRIRLAIRLHADNQLFVSGMGLESEWRADLRVSGTSTDPRVNGRADIVRGTYTFAGKRLDIDHGTVQFEGAALSDPQLNISASTDVNGVDATINITGTGQHPQIAFSSTPALPQDEVLSRLLFGSSVTNLSATEAIQLAAALNSLRGSGGGLDPLGKLRSATGIDRLRILGADSATGQGTSLAAGKYITNNIYVEIITDARGFTATQLQIALTKTLSLLSSTGTFGGSSASIKYQRDF